MLHDADRKLSKCALTKTADHETKEPKLTRRSVAELYVVCVVCEQCCNGLFPDFSHWVFPTKVFFHAGVWATLLN